MTPNGGAGGGRVHKVLVFGLFAFSAAGLMGFDVTSLAGQENEAGELLTLDDAVGLALAHSPRRARAVKRVGVARAEERRRLGGLLPTLSAAASFNGTTSRTKTAFDEFGEPKRARSYEEHTTSSTAQSLAGGVALFDLRAIREYSAARARTGEEVVVAARDAAALRTTVGRAYYQWVRRRELIAVEEAVRRTAAEQLSATRELLRVAARQPTDVLGAELALAQAEQAVARARGEAWKSALLLNEAMGVSLDRAFVPGDTRPRVFDPARLDVDELVARARRDSPVLLVTQARVRAAEVAHSAAQAARFPTLSLDYRWGRGASLREYDAFRELSPENSSWGFGLRLGFPVFTGLQTSSSVAVAALEVGNARVAEREASLALERSVRTALIDLSAGHEAVRLAERSAAIARARLAQGQALYRLGTLDYTALSQMSDQVAGAERQVLDARFQFAEALLELEEMVGGTVGAGG